MTCLFTTTARPWHTGQECSFLWPTLTGIDWPPTFRLLVLSLRGSGTSSLITLQGYPSSY